MPDLLTDRKLVFEGGTAADVADAEGAIAVWDARASTRGEQPVDVTVAEVLGNIDAMAAAIQQIGPGAPITVEMLLDFHRRLVTGTRLERHAGRIRSEQNWIGGSDYNPCSATFVPPPPEFVSDLLGRTFPAANEAVKKLAMPGY